MGSIESFPGHYLLLLSTPCEVPARLMVSAMLDVIKFSSSAVIDRVGRVPGILILILLGLKYNNCHILQFGLTLLMLSLLSSNALRFKDFL